MAGDWIKMEINLRDKPEVIAVATKLALHRDLVVGKLFLLWCWFDQHTNDGHARGVTPAFVDELVAVEGFALALASESWLIIRNGAIVMPNFDRHLSKSAKNRALGKERVQRFRNDASVTSPLPEKRREEKRRESASADSPCKSPTGDERKDAKAKAGSYPKAFEEWYFAYPRHVGKAAALRAYMRAGKRLKTERRWDSAQAASFLLQKALAFAKSEQGQGEFCPHPATWLNGGRYDDDPREWNRRESKTAAPAPRSVPSLAEIGGFDDDN